MYRSLDKRFQSGTLRVQLFLTMRRSRSPTFGQLAVAAINRSNFFIPTVRFIYNNYYARKIFIQ